MNDRRVLKLLRKSLLNVRNGSAVETAAIARPSPVGARSWPLEGNAHEMSINTWAHKARQSFPKRRNLPPMATDVISCLLVSFSPVQHLPIRSTRAGKRNSREDWGSTLILVENLAGHVLSDFASEIFLLGYPYHFTFGKLLSCDTPNVRCF